MGGPAGCVAPPRSSARWSPGRWSARFLYVRLIRARKGPRGNLGYAAQLADTAKGRSWRGPYFRFFPLYFYGGKIYITEFAVLSAIYRILYMQHIYDVTIVYMQHIYDIHVTLYNFKGLK